MKLHINMKQIDSKNILWYFSSKLEFKKRGIFLNSYMFIEV